MGRYLAWLLMLVAGLLYVYTFSSRHHAHVETIAYSQFKQDVRKGEIAKITMRGHEVRGALGGSPGTHGAAKGDAQTAKSAVPPTGRRFTTTIPQVPDPGLLPLLEKHHVTVRAESTQIAWWLRALVDFLPWLILFGLIFYGSYKMQQRAMGGEGAGGIFGFRKSPAKRFREEVARVSFDEVAGLENAKDDLREIIDYLKEPDRYRGLGAKVPKGVLLVGAPGTGKTLLARAVAGEAGATFYSISGSEFIEMLVGVGAARVRDLFRAAKQEAPAIIFVDEIDSVGRARGTGLGGGNDEREQTLNQILSEMDGFAPHQNVVVLAATNRPDVLDPALLRPGRFDRKVVLDLPDRKARRKILEIHTRSIPLADDVDLDKVAARSVGFSGADIENLANEAALLAGRDRRQEVDMATLERARDKIVLGAERETILSDEDKTIVAYHESGHAMVAWLAPNADPLGKVSIIPRGRALGVTEQTPAEERYNLRRSYLLERLAVMLGGRVAESIVFGDISSGAEADLKDATRLARRMVCSWGMSERLGSVALPQGEEHIFLGREMAQPRDFSEHTAQLVDEEIRRLIGDAERRDEELLGAHHVQLDALAKALLQSETLEHDEIDRILLASAPLGEQRERSLVSA